MHHDRNVVKILFKKERNNPQPSYQQCHVKEQCTEGWKIFKSQLSAGQK